jgi:hypothetical protein
MGSSGSSGLGFKARRDAKEAEKRNVDFSIGGSTSGSANVGANAGAGVGAGIIIKAREDDQDVEKRQFDLSSLTSGLGGSSGTSSGLGSFESLIPSMGGSSSTSGGLGGLSSLIPSMGGSSGSSGTSGLSIPGLSNIPSGSGISSLKAKRQSLLGSGSITSNDVTENSGCKELTFIFARGSDEMGNMGSVVGPPVATQLKSLTGDKVAVQGVTYAATAEV